LIRQGGYKRAGTTEIWSRTLPGEQVPRLIVRDRAGTRVLVEPATATGNASSAIGAFSLSPDGRTAAVHLSAGGSEVGSRLVIRDSVVGVLSPMDTTFRALPIEEHIVFDSTLFIPPLRALNRHLRNELGAYALDLGDGYMLHGTWDRTSIGTDSTHGCIRLDDADLEWLYTYVPVGVTVLVR
jgi:hypothetical protein